VVAVVDVTAAVEVDCDGKEKRGADSIEVNGKELICPVWWRKAKGLSIFATSRSTTQVTIFG
jgi:hypothetical protein